MASLAWASTDDEGRVACTRVARRIAHWAVGLGVAALTIVDLGLAAWERARGRS